MYSYERHKSSSSSWHPPVHHIRNFARRHDLPQTSNIPQMNSAQKRKSKRSVTSYSRPMILVGCSNRSNS